MILFLNITTKKRKKKYYSQRKKGKNCSIPGRVIPKTLKIVLDTSMFNTQQYKVRIKGKEEQSRERSNALAYTLV